jgi:hypothetical protein
VVLGVTLPRGTRVRARVLAHVKFVDAGQDDPKLICGEAPLVAVDRVRIRAFFWCYARAKGWLNRARGKSGRTHYGGIEERVDP